MSYLSVPNTDNEIITNEELNEFLLQENECFAKKGIWRMNDYTEIKITDMTTQHIHNCINMINRKKMIAFDCYIPVFEKELNKRRVNNE